MLAFNKIRQREKGDTLIEVLFAMTVFSMIVVTSLSLMNQGIAVSQRSPETTLVRQQMDGQAEALRFLHESYVQSYESGQTFDLGDSVVTPAEEYYKLIQFVKAGGRTSASKFASTANCVVPNDTNKDFIMNPVTAKLVNTSITGGVFETTATFSQLVFSGNTLNKSRGMWVEGVRSSVAGGGASVGYIDFHIRACWNVLGSDVPMNLGTIVRLYEPRA